MKTIVMKITANENDKAI